MAASLKNRTFTTTGDKKDGVFGDDYVNRNLETWKIKGKTSNGGKWDYKAKITHDQKDGQLSGKLSDELKIQFPYDKYYFWFGTKRNGDLKVHADFGNVAFGGKEYNLFSNLKTNINFKSFAFRAGANYFGQNITCSSRLETLCEASGCSGLALTNRTHYRQGELFYGLVTSFNLNGFKPLKYDAIFGYEKDQTNFYLEHASNSKASSVALGTVTGTATFKKDNTTFGLQVSNDFVGQKVNASLGAETTCDKATVKAKVNKNLDLEFAWKKALNKQLTVTASGKLALQKGAKAVDFSKYVPIPFGVQFEVNA